MSAAVESTEEIRRWVSISSFRQFKKSKALRSRATLLLWYLTIYQEEHTWPIEKLLEKLMSDQDKGLTSDQASDQFQKYGDNALTDK